MNILAAQKLWAAEQYGGIYLLGASGHPAYIGQTKRAFADRWHEHVTLLHSGVHPNDSLQRTFNAQKAKGIHAVILKVAPPHLQGDDLTRWLFAWEHYFIERYGQANEQRQYHKRDRAG